MSKNQSRKGYVVGALVALVSTLFTVAPAQADANGPVTLLPTSGTTFNTIIGSPISLTSTQDPSTIVNDSREATTSYYIISNPDEALITITYSADASVSGAVGSVYTYNADGTSSKSLVAFTGFTASTSVSWRVLQTDLDLIAIPAWSGNQAFNTITLDVAGDDTVEITVQTLVDYAVSGTSQAGIYNQSGFDLISKEETVTFYAPGEVSATTKINSLTPGSTSVSVQVVYGNSINPWFVKDATKVDLKRDGTAVTWSSTATWSAVALSASSTTSGLGVAANTLLAGVNVANGNASTSTLGTNALAGIYSAQAYYNGVTVGAASVVWDASAGPSSRVASVSPTFVNTLDANFSSSTARSASEILMRTGTKTLTIGAQLYTTTESLAASNVEVKAVVGGSLGATTTVTVTGAAGSLVKGGTALTAYGRTDTAGKVSFTITSTTGSKSDAVSVTLYAKKSDGSWAAMDQANGNSDVDVVWNDAAFSTFTAKPATYISGANPTVTFKVADQWGKGISTIDGKTLTVYAVASFGGVENAKSYSGTVVVANGEAKFTFANFAPANGLAQLKATLFQGALNDAADIASATVNVYNTAATDKVAVVDSFAVAVTYDDYVTGDTSDPTVAAKVADANLSATADGVTISGNVLNASGVGQPGVAVTVAAAGVLFYAGGVYSLDTITTNANEFGAFSVNAIAHTVYAKGTTVSITADGKTATTKLVTYLPDSIADENLKFSWTLPAQVVKNTTYAVVLSLTDKWGNPIATTNPSVNAVAVQGLGSVEINSSASAISRNFDAKGQATVFLRSVKDIAGPGSITATLASTFSYTTAEGAAATSSTIGAFNVTNAKATAWDESAWSNTLTSNVEVLDRATATGGTVNVGSFNGKLVVYAANLNGARISWKVGGNWGSAVADSNFDRFDRPTPRRGVTVSVDIYVNGVKTLTKSVVTR